MSHGIILPPFWPAWSLFAKRSRYSHQLGIMERDEIEDLVRERVRAVVSERQNELLDGINSMLSAKFDIMEKNFGEKQTVISEN